MVSAKSIQLSKRLDLLAVSAQHGDVRLFIEDIGEWYNGWKLQRANTDYGGMTC